MREICNCETCSAEREEYIASVRDQHQKKINKLVKTGRLTEARAILSALTPQEAATVSLYGS
jgi:hypothetical protein